MTRKQRRLVFIFSALLVGACAVGLISYALRESFAFFTSPTDILEGKVAGKKRLRLGGLVVANTFTKQGLEANFEVSDGKSSIKVYYKGVLPDLFREGQGVVAEGVYENNLFKADTILAKHDEKYVPKEVVDALKQQGTWKP